MRRTATDHRDASVDIHERAVGQGLPDERLRSKSGHRLDFFRHPGVAQPLVGFPHPVARGAAEVEQAPAFGAQRVHALAASQQFGADAREVLERLALVMAERARAPVHHAQGAQRGTAKLQRNAGIETNVRLAEHERVGAESLVGRGVRDFKKSLCADGVRADRHVARDLLHIQPVRSLEPVPRVVDEAEERDGASGDARRGLHQCIEAAFGSAVEHAQVAQDREPVRFVDGNRGRLHVVRTEWRIVRPDRARRHMTPVKAPSQGVKMSRWGAARPAPDSHHPRARRRATKSRRSWPQKTSPSIT